MRSPLVVLVVLTTTLALAGCTTGVPSAGTGSGTSPSGDASPAATATRSTPSAASTAAAASTPDPCGLVTEADVTSVMGTDPGSGRSMPAGVYRACLYGKLVIVTDRAIDRATFDASAARNPGAQPITGAGDAAVTANDEGGTAVIAWHKGVELNVLIPGGTVDGEKYLAARGLDRV